MNAQTTGNITLEKKRGKNTQQNCEPSMKNYYLLIYCPVKLKTLTIVLTCAIFQDI